MNGAPSTILLAYKLAMQLLLGTTRQLLVDAGLFRWMKILVYDPVNDPVNDPVTVNHENEVQGQVILELGY